MDISSVMVISNEIKTFLNTAIESAKNELKLEYDGKIEEMKAVQEDKITNLEGRIRDLINIQNKATLDSLKTMIEVLHDSIGKQITELATFKIEMKNSIEIGDTDIAEVRAALKQLNQTDQNTAVADSQKSETGNNINIEKLNNKINKVIKDVEDLKLSYDVVSGETTDINARITEDNVYKYRQDENMAKLSDKNDDLEDRSRRDNLLFFDMAEKQGSIENWQDCEKKVLQTVNEVNFAGTHQSVLLIRLQGLTD